MDERERKTDPDGLRPAKPPVDTPGEQDAERLKREAISAQMKRAGQQARENAAQARRMTGPDRGQERSQTPRGVPAPRRETLTGLAPPSGHQDAPASFPPPVIDSRHRTPESGGMPAQGKVPSPVEIVAPLSREPKSGDWKRLWFNISARLATGIVAALLAIIAALGYWAASAINAKREANEARQAAEKKAESRDEQWKRWASVAIWIVDCRHEQQLRANEALLPSPERMGSARKPEAWRSECPKTLPPPP